MLREGLGRQNSYLCKHFEAYQGSPSRTAHFSPFSVERTWHDKQTDFRCSVPKSNWNEAALSPPRPPPLHPILLTGLIS